MLAVVSPEEFQHFMGVADVMRAEAHEKIEAHFQVFKDRMEKRDGITPTLTIREGDQLEMIDRARPVRPGDRRPGARRRRRQGRPGPAGERADRTPDGELRVPITIVPGSMTKEEIVAAT